VAEQYDVVVVGGGTGGATAAKYIKRLDSSIDVTIVEPKPEYYTCYFSNEVIGGERDLDSIKVGYDGLKGHGINFVQDSAAGIDGEKKIVKIAGGQELLALAGKTGASVQVGHTERFNPAVLAMQKHAIEPKFIEAHRISPFTFRSADVGVVLDMMIHDLDLVLALAKAPIEQVSASGFRVLTDVAATLLAPLYIGLPLGALAAVRAIVDLD